MMSSRASDPTFGGCASTNPMLSTQWPPGPSSSSWVSSFPPPPTLSSPALPPTTSTMW
ncbi:hypothetical protein BHE74_00053921 [Ensete ventricosum]|uniref:Uncharacterized protein n=1 Tax=Ensete ventricosum TaxID=4639 RepID=A0A445MLL4_ENSVE|nr:hypothetical protein BHE74_00053921 [Ensete ventricosum]RZR75126.1 hypothetical protein BHM03_00049871 [Ensete ventricosum]